MTGRDQQYIQELFDDLKQALEKGFWLKGDDTIADFIMDANRDLTDSAVAYAWGRLLGAAEMLDVTPLELLGEAGIREI